MEPVIQYVLFAVVIVLVAVGGFAYARWLQRQEEGAPARLIKIANMVINEYEREMAVEAQSIAALQAKFEANQAAYAAYLKKLSTLTSTGTLPVTS